jgi:hypothetical protein
MRTADDTAGSVADDDRVTYSVDDLGGISRTIAVNYAGLRTYVVGLGLAPSPMPEG